MKFDVILTTWERLCSVEYVQCRCSVEDEGRGAGSIETTRATQRARHVCSAAPQMHCALHCLGWKLNFALSITLQMHPRCNSANIVCIVHVLHLVGMQKKAFHGTAAENPLFCIMHIILSSVTSVTPFGNNTQESLYVKFQQKDTVNVNCKAPPHELKSKWIWIGRHASSKQWWDKHWTMQQGKTTLKRGIWNTAQTKKTVQSSELKNAERLFTSSTSCDYIKPSVGI